MPTIAPLHRLICLTVLLNTAASAARFTVLLYALHLGASSLQAGLIGAAYALLPALGALRVGTLVDRIGPKRPMLIASATLAFALLFAVDNIYVLFAVVALIGLSNNVWFISHQQLVGAYARPGNSAAGYIASGLGFSVAALIAPIAAGAGVDGIGYRSTLLAFLILPLAVNLLLLRGMLDFSAVEMSRSASASAPALSLLADRELRRTFIVGAMFEASWTLFAFLVPLLGTALGLSATSIGIVASSISVSTFACRIVLPWIVRRVPNWRLLIGALMILALGYTGMALATSVATLAAFGVLVGVGQSMGAPLVNALLYEGAPPGRSGQAIALRSSGNYALQLTLPLATGALATALGAAAGFWLLAGALAASVWYARPAWNPRPG